MKAIHLSTAQLREFLDYNPETGVFTWRRPLSDRMKVGDIAGTRPSPSSKNYVMICVDGKIYAAHRLAFVWMGVPVPDLVDHEDRNPLNNRWSNLKDSTPTKNKLNSAPSDRALPPYIVANQSRRKPFRVQIKSGGVHIAVKTFPTLEEAVAFRDEVLKSGPSASSSRHSSSGNASSSRRGRTQAG